MITAQLSDELPPCRIATADGPVDPPCRWRERGLAVVEHDPECFVVTHEPSGRKASAPVTQASHALGMALALLSLPLDWSKSFEELVADFGTISPKQKSLAAAIATGTIEIVEIPPREEMAS